MQNTNYPPHAPDQEPASPPVPPPGTPLAEPTPQAPAPPVPDDSPITQTGGPSDKAGPITGEGSKQPSGWRDFGSFLSILGIAGVLAFLLITFVFRSYAVDGPSMETTLQHQDKLIIWKLPRTIASVTGNQYVPGRGEIIIFNETNLGACGQDGERQLIKRVIGVPGDHVVVRDGTITVYNAANPGGFQPDRTLAYNKDNRIPVTTGNIDVTLAKNQLFVSGDNRPDSCDSRAFGPIETDQVIGKLVLRLLPANNISVY